MHRARSTLVAVSALTALAGIGAPSARAGSATNNLVVAVEVLTGCQISTNQHVIFGQVTFGSSANADGIVSVTCNETSLPVNLALDAGQNVGPLFRSMVGTAGGQVTYALFKDAARTQPWGDSDFAATYASGSSVPAVINGGSSFTIYGQIVNSYADSDLYNDTVTVTVHF